MKTKLILCCLLPFAFCLRLRGQYSIDWFTIDGGGGTGAGGVYSVSGTIGQHDGGGPMTGGIYSLTGGFWVLISVVQTPGTPSLTITLNSQLSTVTVSWPSTGNYTLQQNNNLGVSAGWTTSGYSITTSNGTNSITITPPTGNLFSPLEQSVNNGRKGLIAKTRRSRLAGYRPETTVHCRVVVVVGTYVTQPAS